MLITPTDDTDDTEKSVKSVKSDVKKGTTEDTEDTEQSVKSVKSVDKKKVENNKSAFYSKINGFLFGSFKNNRYLCISERNNIINH